MKICVPKKGARLIQVTCLRGCGIEACHRLLFVIFFYIFATCVSPQILVQTLLTH